MLILEERILHQNLWYFYITVKIFEKLFTELNKEELNCK